MIPPLVVALLVFGLLLLLKMQIVVALAWACLAYVVTWLILGLPRLRMGGRAWRRR